MFPLRALLLSVLPLAVGCAHTPSVSDEQRLDESTASASQRAALDELLHLDCSNRAEDVQRARDEDAERSARSDAFSWAVSAGKAKVKRFDDAFSQNPDLLYSRQGESLKVAREHCAGAVARLELEQQRFEASVPPRPKALTHEAKVAVAAQVADDAFASSEPVPAVKSTKSIKSKKAKRLAKAKSKLPKVRLAQAGLP